MFFNNSMNIVWVWKKFQLIRAINRTISWSIWTRIGEDIRHIAKMSSFHPLKKIPTFWKNTCVGPLCHHKDFYCLFRLSRFGTNWLRVRFYKNGSFPNQSKTFKDMFRSYLCSFTASRTEALHISSRRISQRIQKLKLIYYTCHQWT